MNTNLLSISVGLLALTAGFSSSLHACGLPQLSLDALAGRAVSENKAVSAAAIAQLRATGPQGLDVLLKANAAAISRHENPSKVIAGANQERLAWVRLTRALDAVSGQCDSFASQLYWYTDFQAANAAAKASGKPILSLRLLGRLDEEYSCANSRFFRTTLYANTEVSRYLRDHFILHWQSVRPVPRITIDFGDGRKIERTITGNSAHYILDSNGQVVDVLPGLYGPKTFLQELKDDEQIALDCEPLSAEQRQERLAQFHAQRREAAVRAWNADLARLGEQPTPLPVVNANRRLNAAPTAKMAGQLAISKRAIESPLLKSTQPSGEEERPARASVSDELWARIAALHATQARLDSASFTLIASKLPTSSEASERAASKSLVETPALRTLRNLQRSIAEDTVRNEYLLHQEIHNWFVQNGAPSSVDNFNAKVYAELFLMPESDPWLGLVPANVFTALPNDGLVEPVSTLAGR